MVGGATFDQSLEALATFGRIVTFGMASREPMKMVHPSQLMARSQSVTGFWLANCFAKPEMMSTVIAKLFEMMIKKELRVIVGATYPLSEASKAHQVMRERGTVGKIVLDPRL
jgi:NADPH2:quinone reductase